MGERELMRELMEAHSRLRYAVAEADNKTSLGLPRVVAAMAKEERAMGRLRAALDARGEGAALDG